MTTRLLRDALLLGALIIIAVLAGSETEKNHALELKVVSLAAAKENAEEMLQTCASMIPKGTSL